MASSSLRPAPIFLSLLAGILIGIAVHASGYLEGLFTPKGIRAIVVGPTPDKLNYPKVKISKGAAEVALWVAKTRTDTLRIEFEDDVFEGMVQQANKRWVPAGCGTSRTCYSGNIKAGTPYIPDPGYKYWQVLIDAQGEHPADGHIIIDK